VCAKALLVAKLIGFAALLGLVVAYSVLKMLLRQRP
jgi:UPF0716 family protein affecting phage T7 exclusion